MASPLAEAHREAQLRIRTGTARAVGQVWKQLGSYDRSDVNRYVLAVAPIIEGGKRKAISTAAAYVGRTVDTKPPEVNINRVSKFVRNGTPIEAVQHRPFVATWKGLKDGKPWQVAVDEGMATAIAAAFTDVALAFRDAMPELMKEVPQIDGYQRVPGGDACDFCVLASTQRYTTGELMPLHNNCGCGVEVLTDAPYSVGQFTGTKTYDPLPTTLRSADELAEITNEQTYSRAAARFSKRAEANRARAAATRREAAAERSSKRAARLEARARNWDQRASRQDLEALRNRAERIRVVKGRALTVQEHGELGPVLTNASHNFTRL